MKLGRFKCLNRKQALSTVVMAMDLGVPLDYSKNFNGEYHTFVSNEGLDKLRKKFGWVDPNTVRKNTPRIKRKKKKKLLPFEGFRQGIDWIRI